ncbi:MAG: arginase family protein, partial [Fimbriimonas ginsengisoli]|nr:arginase family protein [Fimbriimonas ginsengisoli]
MIEVIGVPFDLCGRRSGARLGPSAIRFAGLVPGLEGLGLRVKDSGDLHVPDQPPAPGAIRNLEPLLELTRSLRAHVSGTLAAGRMPLILGGDHASGLGAVAAALERYGEDLALLWIDAHS